MRVKGLRGGASGGTIASSVNLVKEAATDPVLRRELADPYSLCPDGHRPRVRQAEVWSARFDADFDAWVAPFVMSVVNTRIVRRSNALSDEAYGTDFRYDEAMIMGRGLQGRLAATGLAAGLAGFALAAALPPPRWALERFVLPGPGEGPSAESQRKGFFDLRWTISADGTVSHEGQTPGTPEQLTAAQMAELTPALRAAKFMSLEDSYVPEDSCCDRYRYEITVTIGGLSQTVSTIDASPTAPDELTQLVDTLNQLVATPSRGAS